jgi:hypothetical protein
VRINKAEHMPSPVGIACYETKNTGNVAVFGDLGHV